MPGSKSQLVEELTIIFENLDKNATASQKAGEIADAIDSYVGTVQVQIGIPVSTTGTSTAQTGATTAAGILV